MSKRQSFYVGVKAIIARDNGVLLLKDTARDKWEFPGGRIDQNQSIEDALKRELQEEVPGAVLTSLGEVVLVATGDFVVEDEHNLCLVFYAPQVTLPKDIQLSDEHTEYMIAGPDDSMRLDMFTTDQAALAKYFENVKG